MRTINSTLIRIAAPLTISLGLIAVVLWLVAIPAKGAQAPDPVAPVAVVPPSQVQASGGITIPAGIQPVTVDGVCDALEYGDASSFAFSDYKGFAGTIYLKQDNANLYVCMHGEAGPGADRFVAVYLDTDNGREAWAEADDIALQVVITSSATRSSVGDGAGGYVPASIDGWSAVATTASGYDNAEYAIPLALTGGVCNLPFGIALDHHWLTVSGDDYSWPGGIGYNQPSTWQTAQLTSSPCPGEIDISQVPPEFQRRAADYLEDHRGSPSAPGWDLAALSSSVHPLYRPDVEGVAYYEFPVIAPSSIGIQSSSMISAGFIILSTGDHDFPIAHWNFAGESPTQEMMRKAQAAGKRAVKFFKLDTLTYAAEDATGALAAASDTPLLKIMGMSPDWLTNPPTSTVAIWMPDAHLADDSGASTVSGTLTITGPMSAPLTLSEWESWSALKTGYGDSYSVLAEFLRRDAAPDWRVAISMTNIGVILHNGESYTMTLLGSLPVISMEGSGLQHVVTATVMRPGLADAIRFTAMGASPGASYPLTVTVDYSSFTEVVRILVMEDYVLYLPIVMRGSSGLTAQPGDIPQAVAEWSPWNVWWAGSGGDQRLYNQIPAHQAPNTSSCSSGCGATAWGMLFGWADHQAAIGNPAWAGRWGIYRQNGGYGADADAPQSMDSGVKNMIWEIRGRIGTWCAGSSGPTFPWNMSNAAGYLAWRSTVRVDTHYNVIGWSENRLQQYAGNSIVNRHVPAIIGTGWLSHYPLAYGYAWSRRPAAWYEPGDWYYDIRFYVNNGWGGSGNGWVPASTWFAGEIYP